MNVPNRLTVVRLVLAPLFFLVFLLSRQVVDGQIWFIVALVAIYTAMELTDLLDGIIARKHNLVTDLGKVLDPFADVISRITYFLCFTAAGIMPWMALLIILYREFSVTFLRMMMMKKGTAMAANIWGKLKAVLYAVSGIWGLAVLLFMELPSFDGAIAWFKIAAVVLFWLAALASVMSFFTYLKPLKSDWHEIDK